MNPIAGMGGLVGLKGTDGLAQEAERRGAKPLAGARARSCLGLLSGYAEGTEFLTAQGPMGEDILQDCGLSFKVVHKPEGQGETNAKDTKAACKAFLDGKAKLIIFCGGDGTARDVASAVQDHDIPVLGIPAGVKMHSGVFAISPEAAAELALGFIRGDLKTRETEIVDVDEELYRSGELMTRLYSTAKTPYRPALVQGVKQIYASRSEDEFKDQIALFASEFMRDESFYILGAGTTTTKIAEFLGIDKTLLGVDVIQGGKVILKDASEKDLLDVLDKVEPGRTRIIISPIGAQGFILGRGSQQISSKVLRKVGIESLIVISTPHKLSEVPYLLVDTGDPEIDRALTGRHQVLTGYRVAQIKEVKAASKVSKDNIE